MNRQKIYYRLKVIGKLGIVILVALTFVGFFFELGYFLRMWQDYRKFDVRERFFKVKKNYNRPVNIQ